MRLFSGMTMARNRSKNMLKNMKFLAGYYDIYIGEGIRISGDQEIRDRGEENGSF